MINKAQNTAIRAADVETKSKEPYHFAGGLKYKPQTIQASSREEAQEEWEKSRKKAN
jgi:hypothetical protein